LFLSDRQLLAWKIGFVLQFRPFLRGVEGEDGLDFRGPIEPGDEVYGGNAIVDGAANLATDFAGQLPDFTGMRTNF
jgi:hypothetical protein